MSVQPALAALAAGDVERMAALLKADPGLAANDPTLLQRLVLTMPPVEPLECLIDLLAHHGAELADPLKAACGCGNIGAITKLLDLGGKRCRGEPDTHGF